MTATHQERADVRLLCARIQQIDDELVLLGTADHDMGERMRELRSTLRGERRRISRYLSHLRGERRRPPSDRPELPHLRDWLEL